MATTSFFPAKPLGCYGDGGAIFTSDGELARKARLIARHGQTKRYYHEAVGMNSRLDTLQAAILLEKFRIFDEEIVLRNQVANTYNRLLSGKTLSTPEVLPENGSVFAQYTIRTESRDSLQKALKEAGIPTAVHYPYPLHHQPAFSEFKDGSNLSAAEAACAEVMSLPFHPYLTNADLDYVCSHLI